MVASRDEKKAVSRVDCSVETWAVLTALMKAVWLAGKTAVTTAAWMAECWVDRMVASRDD